MANHNEDNVQHGLDDNPSGDAGKGAALGGLGGAAVGAAAGSLVGPAGTLVGAAIGAISGAIASGAAVAAVDAVDNDNTVSGIGSGSTGDVSTGSGTSESYLTGAPGEHGHNVVTGDQARTDAGASGLTTGALVGGVVGTAVGGPVGAVVGGTAGSLLGGVAGDASEAVAESDTTRHGYSATQEPNMSNTNQNVDPSLLEHSNTTTAFTGNTSNLPRVSREEYDRLDADGRTRVQLIEEELHVGKDVRELGEVEISKRVVEEQVSVPVTLEREELVITRTAGTGEAVAGSTNFTDEVITVPIREEFATVNKTAHVSEEVEIEKRTTHQQTTVGGTVRHEELEVEGGPQSNVRIEGDTNRNI